MEVSFFLFVAMCELILVLVIVTIVQFIFIKKYRPYYMANTAPELFLRKYIQYLIKHTQKFAKSFSKLAKEGDSTAIKTQQHMTARLNWLVLERDFTTATTPDIRYWEDINGRIKEMLEHWKEVEFIKEPPELEMIKLAIEGNPEDFDFENSNIDQSVKDLIHALKKKVHTMSHYESMYTEMEGAYKTLEASYNELRDIAKDLKVEAGEAEKLKSVIESQAANEESIEAMMTEMESSKERLSNELVQLEEAYVQLERGSINSDILRQSENPDAKEILAILDQQQKIFEEFKKTLNTLNLKTAQRKKVNSQADQMEKTHQEINYSMQMLEIERERLETEIKQAREEPGGE